MPKFPVKFIPAEYKYSGSRCYITYQVVDPKTDNLKRITHKVNYIKNAAERRKYAEYLVYAINEKLYSGWNPLVEDTLCDETTIRDACNMYLEDKQHLRPDSLRSYRSYNKIFLEWCEKNKWSDKIVSKFDKAAAKKYMAYLSDKNPRTWNNYLKQMQSIFAYFVANDIIKSNPFHFMAPRKVDKKIRKIIPPEVRSKILDYYKSNNMNEFVVVMNLCYKCLIRPKEMRMLKLKHINFAEMVIDMPADISKNHHERIIPLHDDLQQYFIQLKDYDKNLYLFSESFKPGKKMIAVHAIDKAWNKMKEALNLPADYQFYSLKDTGITEMLEAGVPAKLVKELADHHSLEMTERYTHKSDPKKILEWSSLEF